MEIYKKTALEFVVSAVMDHRRSNRNLILASYKTRCLKIGEIHEFLVSAEFDGTKDKILNDVTYLGFFEIIKGGVIEVGDRMKDKKGRSLGVVVGFDENHAPNHLNIILKSDKNKTGKELGLKLRDEIIIEKR